MRHGLLSSSASALRDIGKCLLLPSSLFLSRGTCTFKRGDVVLLIVYPIFWATCTSAPYSTCISILFCKIIRFFSRSLWLLYSYTEFVLNPICFQKIFSVKCYLKDFFSYILLAAPFFFSCLIKSTRILQKKISV